MAAKISLKELERSLFRDSTQTGLIEIQIGSFLLIFSLAPLLSSALGDFWSSVIFLPFWALVFWGIRTFRTRVLQPRVGRIEYGTYRQGRLAKLNRVILAFNLAALALGILSFFQFSWLPGWVPAAQFSIVLLVGFSLAGYLLEFPRLYAYGLLIALAPPIGEFLYTRFGFSHHGFPVAFGFASAVLIFSGVIILVQLLNRYPLPDQEQRA